LRRAIELQCSSGAFCDDDCIFKEQCDINAGGHRGCSYTWAEGISSGNFTLDMSEDDLEEIIENEPESILLGVQVDESGNRVVFRGDGSIVYDPNEEAELTDELD
jgi:hypothetical protein